MTTSIGSRKHLSEIYLSFWLTYHCERLLGLLDSFRARCGDPTSALSFLRLSFVTILIGSSERVVRESSIIFLAVLSLFPVSVSLRPLSGFSLVWMRNVQEAWDSILCVLLSTLLLSSCCFVVVAPTRGGNCQNPVPPLQPTEFTDWRGQSAYTWPPSSSTCRSSNRALCFRRHWWASRRSQHAVTTATTSDGRCHVSSACSSRRCQRWILGQRLRLAIAHVREFGAWLEWATRCRPVLWMVLHNFTATRSRIFSTMLQTKHGV